MDIEAAKAKRQSLIDQVNWLNGYISALEAIGSLTEPETPPEVDSGEEE